ncbi:hypothetical protein SNEBB_006501 [Seison nebaliae]|nr:hypothetical protein SNEBB_006501 [Seison nebaliae]
MKNLWYFFFVNLIIHHSYGIDYNEWKPLERCIVKSERSRQCVGGNCIGDGIEKKTDLYDNCPIMSQEEQDELKRRQQNKFNKENRGQLQLQQEKLKKFEEDYEAAIRSSTGMAYMAFTFLTILFILPMIADSNRCILTCKSFFRLFTRE